jgi:hypothetical protein
MLIGGLFLPWYDGAHLSLTAFELFSGFDIAWLLLGVLAFFFALLDFAVRGLLSLAGAIGLVLLGAVGLQLIDLLALGASSGIGAGQWLMLAGAFAASIVGWFFLATSRTTASEPDYATAPPPAPRPTPPPPSVPQPQVSSQVTAPEAPPGWYPDPLGQASERYWNGSWSNETR